MIYDRKSDIRLRWVSENKEWNNIGEFVLFLKQKKAYQFASEYCQNKYVLDYGCGSGYGAAFLSSYADKVIAVDISEEVIDFCRRTYPSPNTSFQKINPDYSLPFDDNVFDIIISFQVMEHIFDVRAYLLELKRVLKEKGILFITTPNRKHRLLPFQKPWNIEHIREYSSAHLRKELNPVFNKVEILGVYGTDEINAIEYNRVRQSPLKVYIYRPGIRLLKILLPSAVIKFFESIKQKLLIKKTNVTTSVSKPDFLSEYSLDDFTVGNKLDKCLDFLAVCYKG